MSLRDLTKEAHTNAERQEFVISLLMEVFRHNENTARDIMLQIHEQGSGVAGTYSFEIAEAKAVEATNAARTNNHPLQIKLEEE